MPRLLLLSIFLLVFARLCFSRRSNWVAARRTLARIAAVGASAFVVTLGLWAFSGQQANSSPSAYLQEVAKQAEASEGIAANPPEAREVAASRASDSDSTLADKKPMLLFVSAEELQRLLSEDGLQSLGGLEGLQRAYAMVPLSAKGPPGVPPVLREALSPAALRQVLSPSGLQIMATALTQILAIDTDKATVAVDNTPLGVLDSEAELPDTEPYTVSDPPHVLATWVNNPGVGQVVVKSEFMVASTPEEDALRLPIVAALKRRVDRAARRELGGDGNWDKLVDVSLTDNAILNCIVSTDARTEVLETPNGSHPMQQTYALVEFPEAMEQQVISEVKSALRNNRLIGLCVSVACLWLSVILFSMACRASQSDSLLRRVASFPVMTLLIVPCLLVFAFMVGAMIKGATFEFATEDGRITCVIDQPPVSR